MKMNIVIALMAFSMATAMSAASEAPNPNLPPDANNVARATPISNRSIYQLDATWSDDAGHALTLISLQGRPVLLAMFFTSCENACPIIVNEMKRIKEALPNALRVKMRLVLVSFDSDHDSPAILRQYRARMQLGDDWVLIHGQPDDVRELAMVLGVNYAKDSRGQFAHSNLITVLNPAGEIAFQRAGLTGDISGAVNAVAAAP
jgi:protein SCO1